MTSVKFSAPIAGHVRAAMFAQLGLRVFPIQPRTKTPAIKGWPQRATTDLDQIDRWWNWSAKAGSDCGILTGAESGIWVLDPDRHVDRKTKKVTRDGLVEVRALFERHGEGDPDTFRVATPHGEQWWFAYPDEGKVGNFASRPGRRDRIAPGVDVRGWHGQVVAPLGPNRQIVHDVWPPRPAPDWLLQLVLVSEYEEHVPSYVTEGSLAEAFADRIAAQLASCESGGRNAELNTAAFRLGLVGGRGLLSRDYAFDVLARASQLNGLHDDDGEDAVRATFTSGWTAGAEKSGQ